MALGLVQVFVAPEPAPAGLLRKGEQATWELLARDPNPTLTPERFERYFRLWLGAANTFDKAGVIELLRCGPGLDIAFRQAAERFRLIPDEGSPVIVRWGESERWLARLRSAGPDRWLMRKLQRYSVTVRRDCLDRLVAQGDVAEILPGLYAQEHDLLYDPQLGFPGCAEDAVPAAEHFIV